MKKFTEVTKNIGNILAKNSPHILTVLGCTGLISTAILTGKATPKALHILEEEVKYRKQKDYIPLNKWDKVKLTWKCYIPAGVVGLTSIGCIIGAHTVNTKRNAALAALYSLSETAFRDYKTKVVEEIGRPKETKIRDEVAKDHIVNNPLTSNKTVIMTAGGDVLCYDVLSDRYFKSSYETIRRVATDLNFQLIDDLWLDLNDFYYALGLPSIKLGNQMGFDIQKGKIEVFFSTQLDLNGNPCVVIDLDVYPKYNQ